MKHLYALCVLIFTVSASAQIAAINGYCNLGGAQSVTSGLSSSNYLLGIIPSCTVKVYLTGTTTLATIYSDSSETPLTNPFTANAASSTNPGYWLFFAAANQGYDVSLSGGISPNVYSSAVTLTGMYPGTNIVAGITQLTGDVLAGPGSGSLVATVVRINGAAIPASATVLGSNSSSQLVVASTTGSGSVVLATSPTLVTPNIGNATAKSLNNVYKVEQFSGATADVQLNACIAQLTTLTGGICDATGYGATNQTIAATVTVGNSGNNPIKVIMSNATTFRPSSALCVAGSKVFEIEQNGQLIGLSVNADANCPVSTSPFYGNVVVFDTTIAGADTTLLQDANIFSNGTTGNAIAFLTDNTTGTQYQTFVKLEHVRTTGFLNALDMDNSVGTGTSGGQFINGNIIDDFVAVSPVNCITMNTGSQGVAGDSIDGNIVSKFQCEGQTGNYLNMTGTVASQISFNRFIDFVAWDSPSRNSLVMGAAATFNYISGISIAIYPPSTAGFGNIFEQTDDFQQKVQPNLLQDTDFVQGTSVWNATSAAAVVSGVGCQDTTAFVATTSGTAADVWLEPVDVVPGATYTLTACMNESSATSGQVNLNVIVIDSTNPSYPSGTNIKNYYLTVGQSQSRILMLFTIPTGVTSVQILWNDPSVVFTTANTVSFSAPMLQYGSTNTDYVSASATPLLASILSGTTLASNVVSSSLTSVGTLTSLSTGPITESGSTTNTFSGAIANVALLSAINSGSAGIGVFGSVTGTGGVGVQGSATSGNAIWGNATSGEGVYGSSTSGTGVEGESLSNEAGYFMQDGTLTASTTHSTLYAYRNQTLGSYTSTGAIIRGEDTTASTGNLFELVKQGTNVLSVSSAGNTTIGGTLSTGVITESGSTYSTFTNTSTGIITGAIFLGPNIGTGNYTRIILGTDVSNYNALDFNFINSGGTGSASNYGLINIYGRDGLVIFSSGNVSIGNGTDSGYKLIVVGTASINSGTNQVYRCTTAGTLPIGTLTITTGDCGASTATGLYLP